MRQNFIRSWGFVAAVLTLVRLAVGSDTDRVDYLRDVKPVLKERCYACHGVLKQEGGLRLDSGELIRAGSGTGPVLAAGVDGGTLLERIRSNDSSLRMPPEGEPLTSKQIEQISRWIQQGASSPADEKPQPDPRLHWAYQAPLRPALPTLTHDEWVQNPIDSFIGQSHERAGLVRQPTASKETLLRRVTLDLIGLPPTPDELREFLADNSPDALAAVVDRLLESPAYGERWGRHWMDVWRYSDWFGRRYVPDVWNSAPQIWRWRDWIVGSLNADKSYARMVSEMLAGDEVDPENPESGFATGYLIRNWYALNPNDWMRSNVEHVGKAFLGLTFNCAHCHDHKYDPITQNDYFRFRAFFEPIAIRQDRVAGEADPGQYKDYEYGILRKIQRLGGVQIYDKEPTAPTWFYTGGDERNRLTDRGSIPAGVPGFLATDGFTIQQLELPPRGWYPGLRPEIQRTVLADHEAALRLAEAELPAARTAAESALPDLQVKLAEAEREFESAVVAANSAGRSGGLTGRQSLVLDASAGRRLVLNGLRNVNAFQDGMSIQFRMRIQKDAHFNFQLVKDSTKGLTAGLVAFDKGKIISYQPGTTTEFEVGQYDFAAGQKDFSAALSFLDGDRCRLSIVSLSDSKTIVPATVVARNGWNPVGNAEQAIAFDAKTGSSVVIDDVIVETASPSDPELSLISNRLAKFDFEQPLYVDGHDVIGVDGWFGSSFNVAGATSTISSTSCDASLAGASQKVIAARRALEAVQLKVLAFEAKRLAALAGLESTNARIAADRAKYGETRDQDAKALSLLANQIHRKYALLAAQAELLECDYLQSTAELKPSGDANRAKEIDAAKTQRVTASIGLDKAQIERALPPDTSYPPLSPVYPQVSTGRRKALVDWMSSPKNPLTARVAVNHIWMRHFHAPLVASVSDFGVNGATPTHPELLDWLAVELMESNWSMKHVHKLIVTSGTYALSSNPGPSTNPSRAIDPENRLLWRMNQGRMESEIVRDSLLAVAGHLDQRMGGQELENSQALTTRRRTLYYCCEPEIDGKSEFGALFDAPEPAECYRRTKSIIPQQALALTNSQLVHDLSESLASKIATSLPIEHQADDAHYASIAYERILSRKPTDAELQSCVEFLKINGNDAADQVRLRQALVRVLLNHNDFVSIR